jgi:hypothetical protein
MADENVAPPRAIVTIADAKALGLKRYFTGMPCKHGHIADRLVSNGTCMNCSNSRCLDWQKKNREKCNANFARHVAKDPDAYKAKARAAYQEDKARRLAVVAAWASANLEKSRLIKARWKKRHPENGAAYTNKRRAQKLNATPPWADLAAIAVIYAECARITKETGIEHHVDHIVPLKGKRVCGLHVPWNLQIITAHENCSKNNRMPEDLAA